MLAADYYIAKTNIGAALDHLAQADALLAKAQPTPSAQSTSCDATGSEDMTIAVEGKHVDKDAQRVTEREVMYLRAFQGE